MRKLCTFLATLALVVLCIVLLPAETKAAEVVDSGTCGENLTWTLDDEGTLIISGTGEMYDYKMDILTYHPDLPWDWWCVKNVIIEEGVTSIGEFAFQLCILNNVIIPDSITSIGAGAFYRSSLTQITIPNGITHIENFTFAYCDSLKCVNIPDSVTDIGGCAFYNSPQLSDVTYCGTPEQWDEISFGIAVDMDNASLMNATRSYHKVNDGICTVCGVYGTCGEKLTWTLDEEGTLVISGTGPMYEYNLFVMPPEYSAPPWFKISAGIRAVVIEDGVTSIGHHAFYYFSSMTSMTIPNSVKQVNDDFYVCVKLKNVTYCGTVEDWNKIDFAYNTCLNSASRTYHNWSGGDCITSQHCTICGKVNGVYSHEWIEATCTSLKFCFLCGVAEGDYGHNWKNATCTTPQICIECGATEGLPLGHSWISSSCTIPRTCSLCGITEGKAPGHTYDDDRDYFCNTCNYSRLITESTLQYYSTPGLSFQDYIGIQILAQNSVLSEYDKFYAVAVQETPDGDIETILSSNPYFGAYQIFEQPVVSWSMTEKVTLTLYAEKNGIVYQGETISASVAELAMNKLATYKAQNNTKACTALVDMLNYGAAVQTVFNRNINNLPNANLGDYAAFGSTNEPALSADNAISGTAKISVLTDNISLQDKVELQLLFNADISAYTPKATVNGIEAKVIVDTQAYASYGWTVVRVAVEAAKVRDTYTLALYNADGNAVTQVYEISVEGYANSRKDTDKHALDVALMRYGDSVAAL